MEGHHGKGLEIWCDISVLSWFPVSVRGVRVGAVYNYSLPPGHIMVNEAVGLMHTAKRRLEKGVSSGVKPDLKICQLVGEPGQVGVVLTMRMEGSKTYHPRKLLSFSFKDHFMGGHLEARRRLSFSKRHLQVERNVSFAWVFEREWSVI